MRDIDEGAAALWFLLALPFIVGFITQVMH